MKIDIRLVLVIVGGLTLHFIVAAAFMVQRRSALDGLKTETQALEAKWEDEDKELKEIRENELQEKYGSNPLDRIAADPRKDIQLALQKMFKAVLDSEYTVDVTVDRFTEFRVYLVTGNLPEPSKLAEAMKEVFTRVDPSLVYEIVFTDGDRFRVIEPYQFQALDWANATPMQIVQTCLRK